MSRHLSTRNISSKSIHAFLSNLANRQTDKRTRANAFTSSFVGGNKCMHRNGNRFILTSLDFRKIGNPLDQSHDNGDVHLIDFG